MGDRWAEAASLSNLASSAGSAGDYDEAIAGCEASLRLARAADEPQPMVAALHSLAFHLWARGEAAAATRRFEEALALARERGVPSLVPTILVGLGFTAIDLRDYPRAAAAFHEGLDLGRARGNLGDVIDVLEGLARLGADLGQIERAARLFGAALTLREEIGVPRAPQELAYFEPVLTALRDALGAEGFAAAHAAGQSLSRAEAMAEARAVRADPTESPTAAARRRSVAPHGLTERETEILRLLAAGTSNRGIGERLFISPATVARHVANLFAKLGVDSRAKATAYAHRHGLG